MKHRTRIGVGLCAGALALALAGTALASFSPKLWASHTASGVTLKVAVGAADDPTAKVTMYAPLGYQLKDPPPAGTVLGQVKANAQAVDLGGAILPLTGQLVAADPNSFTGPPNNSCSPGKHAQVWILNLTAAGQTLAIPMYVDPTAGAAAAFASFTIQVCLPPPDVPVGTPGRAQFGAKLLDAEFGTSGVVPAAAGGVWHSLWTPWKPGAGTVNTSGTLEAQAKASPAPAVSLTAKKKAKGRSTLTAKVAPAAAGSSVVFVSGGKTVARARTNAAGVATATVAVRKAASFTATATIADADLGSAGCVATVPGSPFPCVSATAKGGKATSKAVRVRP